MRRKVGRGVPLRPGLWSSERRTLGYIIFRSETELDCSVVAHHVALLAGLGTGRFPARLRLRLGVNRAIAGELDRSLIQGR